MPPSSAGRRELARRLAAAVAAEHGAGRTLPTPLMAVDLDAFDRNAGDLVRRAGGKPVRVASTSVRVPFLLERALAHDGIQGVLCFTLREAMWLYEHGLSRDLVVAYPSVDRATLAQLVSSPAAASAITVMIDDIAHLEVIDSVRHSLAVPVRIAIDVDAGLRIGGRNVGPKRSPLHDPAAVADLARHVVERRGFRLVGVMTYEGRVAGLPDAVPSRLARSIIVRGLEQASHTQIEVRRQQVAEALAGIVDLELWIAGGSGSVESSAADPAVTQVAAGSGLLAPALVDHHQSFEPHPAAFFALPVTRRPSRGIATVHGGGLVASGAVGRDRLPTPWIPEGVHLTALEGAGEVQTPLTGPMASRLRVGDLVWFRHAKSGEPFEHTTEVRLLAGDTFVDTVETYRGLGLVF